MKIAGQILDSARVPGVAAAIAAALLLVACGQKGPLYLPTGEAAAGRATLPQSLRPDIPASPSAAPASAAEPSPPPATGTANPIHNTQ